MAWLLAKRLAPEVAGDGVPQAVAALEVQGGRMRPRVIPLKILATAVTIGSGSKHFSGDEVLRKIRTSSHRGAHVDLKRPTSR